MSAAKHTPGPWEASYHRTLGHTMVTGGIRHIATVYSERDRNLIAAAPELLAVAQEAVRIDKARLILADGLDDNGHPFTEAQRNDAKAFLANRSAAWLHEAVAAIAKAEVRS